MKKKGPSTRRQLLHLLCGAAGLPLLSSCGTIIYPRRVNQWERGGIDPAIAILDGIGLFFFVIPGLIAFAVDFGTGAIFYPAGKDYNDPERTIFDSWKDEAWETGKIDQPAIERFIAEKTGHSIKLDEETVLVRKLDHIGQFDAACRKLAVQPAWNKNYS